MFFLVEEIIYACRRKNKRQKEYIRELNKDKMAYDNIMDNLNSILNKYGDHNINTYFLNGQLYYIVEKWMPSICGNDYIIELYTYKLNEIPVRISPIAELSARIKLNDTYNKKTAYIESIDTMRELRCGHGSQILKRFIYIVKNTNVSVIGGELYNSTPIGVENLKKFYVKNGFQVGGKYFSMVIKEPRV
ncbi:hypothetical protein [Proteiniborus sp. MB09-C3]|uniref:hypothetical protein n=1 Tax=Proteiniborus sp. MB09-C3 TaxID=3050072 RepID=UPI002554AD36|nr:hypothetical protein [Proteiniborus sp. MB09-C3]WIV11123.1 hypothetical protein QO263_13320 [Proteiniborus sp. MB09-C3]